jgi:ATP-dependent Clp protease ATP-binding subunit ClpA
MQKVANMSNKMERFTSRAKRVMSLAHDEAEQMQHETISTEHLLLAMLREDGGVAGRVLRDLDVKFQPARQVVENMIRVKTNEESIELVLSSGLKRVLELAVDEARRLEHLYLDTGHFLLALVRHETCSAVQVLKQFDVTPEDVRRQVRRVLQEVPRQTQSASPTHVRTAKDHTVRLTLIDSETETVKSHMTLSIHQLQMILDIVRQVIDRHETSKIILNDKDNGQRIEIDFNKDMPPTGESDAGGAT